MKPAVLPEGIRLLHIGPFKTGTTTLQAGFHQNRPRLQAQGVHYAGKNAQPMTAAVAAIGGRFPTAAPTGPDRWAALVEEIDRADARRTVLSSEFFCEADPAHIRKIIDDLGRSRTHVVITFRPLVRILASQWQQYLQNQIAVTYPEWLDAMLNHAGETTMTPSFWRRHRHDRLVRRWVAEVGSENVTVVAVDETDKRMLMRSFEQMLSLEPDTLVPHDVSANRSLTFAEAEMMRSFNEQHRAHGWSTLDYTRFVRFGAARYLQERRPEPDEARVLTPQWAVDRTVSLAADMVSDIAASGVRIVGNLDSLTDALPAAAVGDNPQPATLTVDVASRFSAGLLEQVAGVPAKPAASTRAVGPFEETLRVAHELRKVEAELRRVASRLNAEREAAGSWRVEDLTAGELWRVLGTRLRARAQRAVRRGGPRPTRSLPKTLHRP